jgi:hypothetical protein
MNDAGTPTTTRRRALLAVAIVAVVAAGAVAVALLHSPSKHPDRTAAAPRVAAEVPSAAPTTPEPSHARRPVVPHDFVAPDAPTAFRIDGRGFTIGAHVCAMPPVFPLDPPGEQRHTVCWVTKGFGVRPGSRTATTYVLGHSWAEDPLEVLNKVSERATREVLREKPRHLDGVPIFPARSLVGATITLRTPQGILKYKVRNAFGVDKLKLGYVKSIMDPHVRNRVVLFTCAELHGVDYNYNIVLDARLVSSRSTSSKA